MNNLEWTKYILLAAQHMNSPLIVAVSEAQIEYMCGYPTIRGMVESMMDYLGITVPVALHLDHGSFEGAKKAIEANYTSVMFDGSRYGFEENIEKSKEIIALAHAKGISVKCEVGGIAFSDALKEYYGQKKEEEPKGYDPRVIMKYGMDAVYRLVCGKIELFGSKDKA